MTTRIQKWGNSHGLRISKALLEDADLTVGDEVDVSVRDGILIVTPARRVRGKVRLEDLVRKIPKGYRPSEVDWGPAVGREVD